MQGLTEGRMVHYVLSLDREYIPVHKHGEHRPAVVVKVWRDSQGYPQDTVQLQVFVDGENDGFSNIQAAMWKTSVPYDPEGKPGTWHWIERA